MVAPAVAAGGKGICNWLKRKYRYVKHINRNWRKLEVAKQDLIDKKLGVETELANNSSNKEKTEECETWLKRVANIIVEMEAVEKDYRNKPCTCLCGLCPYCPLHKLGKRIVKKTSEATNLKDELNKITTMRDKPASIPHSRRWNNDVRIVNHPSLENNVATLLEWLKDDKLKRICIWGPPGVGKTTMMKTVLDKMPDSCNFDHIFVVTVTAEDIQEVIWSGLGMRMDENTNPRQRAAAISEKLEAKKYLLFLDEVSSPINLEEVGLGSNHTQGKVVFLCRDKYIGHTDEDMNVQRLSKEDARKLFWEAVGSEKKGEIKRTAEQIIDLCGGMPPILMLIGKNLRGKNDLAVWRDMKSQLQSPSEQPWQEWEEYYRSFKLVYDELPANDHKPCLLYWAIFPFGEEINGDYIIDCWAAEQFLRRHQRLWQARDRGHAILDGFTDKSLLEKGEKLGHFKMFVCFQRAALRIANREEDQKFFAEYGERMENHEWVLAKRVSLSRMCPSPLPEKPKCTGMLTLLLHENSLTEFPGQFFECMPDLQVLCLWETGIDGLPSSISKLKNLKGLFLDNCSQLVQLPHQIGDLQSLEILAVRHTGIYSLPSKIGRLGNLKCLRISFKEAANQNHVTARNNTTVNCNQNGKEEKIIPGEIIKKLSKLQVLSIDVSPNIRAWHENADVIASEIATLKELTHLHFYFPHMESFECFIRDSESWKANGQTGEFVGFKSFNFFVGQQGNSSASDFNVFECSDEKHLKFSAGNGFPKAVSDVLKLAKSFELIGHRTALNLTDNLPADTLRELEACIVEECEEMQSIVTAGSAVFQCLKKLLIRKLPNLVSIWHDKIASESFPALTTLTLKECQGIKILFSLEMVRQLPELQHLQVEDCAGIENIIEAGTAVQPTVFPKLKNFQLCKLPRLSSICGDSLKWPSLEIILIKTCENLREFPSILENTSKLRKIQCAEDWWGQQDWTNKVEIEGRFKNLLVPSSKTKS